ncbi:aminotransferase class IV [Comamonas sp. Y6]|uniref:Aminotransferase class IV n=1 Tax=Comamonas resistens TaxID=3046670 RepID=A0ABY8SRG5_9BURK|nr:aminotransferase class IV [Comamonas resistens]MDL5038381.1 aminotransferase class IV [Comamonas resistens]WHS64534.1 aminotransferase class IV [Comamonas resistens]
MNTNFEILETLALKSGHWQNWPLHWARLQITAQHFRYPLMQMQLESDMARLAQSHERGDWRVRLALQVSGAVVITAEPLLPTPEPVQLQLARQPLANAVAHGDAVRFKTSVRGHYEMFSPRSEAVFDVVLHNENGEITECTRGNVAMEIGGRWVTPPLSCGLLPGVGRALALSKSQLTEQVVHVDDVSQVTRWAFINSLRGWLEARLVR